MRHTDPFMASEDQPVGAPSLIYWLGMVCERARMATTPRFTRSRVAGEIDRGDQVITDFERGKRVPRELDDILAIYGRLTGRDPRALVQEALDLWGAEGAIRPRDGEESAPRVPKTPPRPPDLTPQKASDGRPRTRRKAS